MILSGTCPHLSARSRRSVSGISLALSLALCWVFGPPCDADSPPPQTGVITGTAAKDASPTAVSAMDRKTGKRYPGKVEGAGFRIEGLPLGATYDVIVDFKGTRLEGVNMKVPRSDYEEEQPLSAEDIETITEKALSLNKFEDKVEVLAIDGNIQHAAVLLNKARTKEFYASKPGEMIWRPELWHFERPEETWTKVQDELFVILYRERIQKSDFEKRSVTFDASLGGVHLTDDAPSLDLGTVQPPDPKPGIRYQGPGARLAKRDGSRAADSKGNG